MNERNTRHGWLAAWAMGAACVLALAGESVGQAGQTGGGPKSATPPAGQRAPEQPGTAQAPAAQGVGGSAAAGAKEQARDVSAYRLEKGTALALGGYDPVAYFINSEAAKGVEEHALVHRGVRYRFASADNREIFLKSPEAFEPAYGGWCALGMSEGERVEPDPRSFRIIDGRLMVFAKGWFKDSAARFERDSAALQRRADQAWKKQSGETSRGLDHNAPGHSCPLCADAKPSAAQPGAGAQAPSGPSGSGGGGGGG